MFALRHLLTLLSLFVITWPHYIAQHHCIVSLFASPSHSTPQFLHHHHIQHHYFALHKSSAPPVCNITTLTITNLYHLHTQQYHLCITPILNTNTFASPPHSAPLSITTLHHTSTQRHQFASHTPLDIVTFAWPPHWKSPAMAHHHTQQHHLCATHPPNTTNSPT